MPSTRAQRRSRAPRRIARDAKPSIPQTMRAAAIDAFGDPSAAVFPLEQVARAHERLESGHVLGKVVLDVGRER